MKVKVIGKKVRNYPTSTFNFGYFQNKSENLKAKIKLNLKQKNNKNTIATTIIAYEEWKTQVCILPSCHPRPESTSIGRLVKVVSKRVVGLPSSQSQDNGYCRMVVTPEEYALVSKV